MSGTPRPSHTPTVSILTPAYNSAKFIRQTLDSVLRQTFTDFEMIVVDDGSTDETRAIVESYAARDPRIHTFTQTNAGIAAARNRAMSVARGRFFALLDSDDLWLPTYLAEQLAILSGRPDVAVLSSNAINFGGVFDGAPLLPTRARGSIRLVSLLELVAVEDSLCILSMFRRDVTDHIGGFDVTLRRSEDYDLWLRAAVAGYRIAVNPKPLGLYRRRPDSISADEVLMLEAMMGPLIKVRQACADRPDVTAAVDRQLRRFAQRCLMASARTALLAGDMPTLATEFAALARETGDIRYRVAGWLTSTMPFSLRWAYSCKHRWLQATRSRRTYRSLFRSRTFPGTPAEREVEVARHAAVQDETRRRRSVSASGRTPHHRVSSPCIETRADIDHIGDRCDPVDSRIAVVIPVYHAQFLARALQSVFAQTHAADEVFVIDDGSPDGSEIHAAVSPYADRVVLVEQTNQGAAAARNRGLHLATAPFVALLDADDQWLPEFLAEQLTAFERQPDADLVYCDGLVIGNTRLEGQRFMQSCPSDGPVTLESLLAQRCTVLLSGVVARRGALIQVGGFDLEIRRGQDFDLWLRMAQAGARMTYQRKVLVLRRIHDENLSGSAVNEQERPLRVLQKTLQTMSLSLRERHIAERRIRELEAALAREHGKEYLRQGQFAAARREFARARHGISSWKLIAASLGLQFAPDLLRRLYLSRSADRRPA